VFVVVGGDAQMDWLDLDNLLQPIAEGEADYTKGNRFIYGSKKTPGNAWREMPTKRILGNVCCSILTKFASGYFHLNDSQMGYTALHKRAFKRMNWKLARKGYGYPAEWLMRFHSEGVRVADVPVRAIYLSNERQTQIRVRKFLFYMMGIIVKGGIERINREYAPTISVPTISIPIRSVFQGIGARIRTLNIIDRIGSRIPFRFGVPSIFSRLRYSGSRINSVFRLNVPMSSQNPVIDSKTDLSRDSILQLANKVVRDHTLPRDQGIQQVSRIEMGLAAQHDRIKTKLTDENHSNEVLKKLRELVHKDEI
jgi:hypothetical protein